MSSVDHLPFGVLLRRLRLAAGRTQAALAELSGLSERAINDLERDPKRLPRLESVALLANALRLSPQDRAELLVAARPDMTCTVGAGASPLPIDGSQLKPPAASQGPRHNLPHQLTSLVGREHDVATVTALLRLDAVRLVTLTGPGGIGKTRLALAAAAGLADAFAHGIWFVRLSRLTDPALVLPTIAQTLGLQVAGSRPIEEVLRAYLREKQLLLLLDNFEQVVVAAPEIASLLESSPGLKALVTSRMALRLRGEKKFLVPPLALPPAAAAGQPVSLERLAQYGAVALFIQQAQEADRGFQGTAVTAPAVAAICARLDGLPLAIELAAAHVKLLPPPALLQRLERRLPLLTGGARDLPERQQTMRAALAWSYDLLTAEEQRLFRRLCVFVGGWSLEAAEAVCAAPAGAQPLGVDMLEGLSALVEKSLVQRREDHEEWEKQVGAEPRFGMLQVIREYGLEQLNASGEAEALRQEHACYFLMVAEQAEPNLHGPKQSICLTRLEHELDNVRAALGWLGERAEGERGLRLVAALTWFWWARSHLREGLMWLEGLLAQPAEPGVIIGTARPPGDAQGSFVTGTVAGRAHALFGVAWLHFALDNYEAGRARLEASIALWRTIEDNRGLGRALALLGEMTQAQGDHTAARELEEEALARCQKAGDAWGAAWALEYLGHAAVESGDCAAAERWLSESLAGFRTLGDTRGVAVALGFLAHAAYRQGDFDKARARAERALSLVRDLGNKWHEAQALGFFAELARATGDDAQAHALAEETLRLAREVGELPVVPWTLRNLGYVALAQGHIAAAVKHLQDALRLFDLRGHRLGIACCLAGLAGTANAMGAHAHAARLLGAAQALLDALCMRLAPADSLAYERTLANVRAALSEAGFGAAFTAGRALRTEEAVAGALGLAGAS
jgi:predicted ATPase/transcriptional regulator with XRE-family HTH domain